MIFKLRFDRFNFMEFELSPSEIEAKLGDIFILDNTNTWSDFWKPINGSFFDDSDKQNIIALPDIALWSTDEIVCNEKAYNILKNTLAPYGEWLPVSIEGVSYWLLHVTQKTGIEFVDVKNSIRTIDIVDHIEIEKLLFNENMLNEMLIFKTQYNNYNNIYCLDKFKILVEENDLQGLIFSKDMTNSPY
ncbi:MAG: hypothetical protein BMS9Abin31_0619 [Gammaproteobacteria bacterium]|nr:MAG: hypothetical protein BMS9Abin31_0619 [Gammaproteobacteria bacterium]